MNAFEIVVYWGSNRCNHRPPEALPAPKQGEYPTGLLKTTPQLLELICQQNFQGISPHRGLRMMS